MRGGGRGQHRNVDGLEGVGQGIGAGARAVGNAQEGCGIGRHLLTEVQHRRLLHRGRHTIVTNHLHAIGGGKAGDRLALVNHFAPGEEGALHLVVEPEIIDPRQDALERAIGLEEEGIFNGIVRAIAIDEQCAAREFGRQGGSASGLVVSLDRHRHGVPLMLEVALRAAAEIERGLVTARTRLLRSAGGDAVVDCQGRGGVAIGWIERREGGLAKVSHRLGRADAHLAHCHRGHIRVTGRRKLGDAHNAELRRLIRPRRELHGKGHIGIAQRKRAQRLPGGRPAPRLPLHHHLLRRIGLNHGRHCLEGDRRNAIVIDGRFNPRPIVVAREGGPLAVQQLRAGSASVGRADRATVDGPAIGRAHPGHRTQAPLKGITQGDLRIKVHRIDHRGRCHAHPEPPVGEVHLAPVVLNIGDTHERAQAVTGGRVPLVSGLTLEQRGNHWMGRLKVRRLDVVDRRAQVDALPARRIMRLPHIHIVRPGRAGKVRRRTRRHARVIHRGAALRHRVKCPRLRRGAIGVIGRIALEDDAPGEGRRGPLVLAVHQARGRSRHAHPRVIARARHRHRHLHAHILRARLHRRSGGGIGRIGRVCARIDQRKRIRHAIGLGDPLRTRGGTPKEPRHHGR